MGQGEIFQFLIENEGQIFTSKNICMALDRATASSALLRLRKYPPEGFNYSKENQLTDLISNGKSYIYWYKKRDRY